MVTSSIEIESLFNHSVLSAGNYKVADWFTSIHQNEATRSILCRLEDSFIFLTSMMKRRIQTVFRGTIK